MITQLLRTAALAFVFAPSVLAQGFCWSENSDNQTITARLGVACAINPNWFMWDNQYWRRYNPLARGVTGEFEVSALIFGVEVSQPGEQAPTQPGTLKIFRDPTPGNPAPKAGLVLLRSEAIEIPNLTRALNVVVLLTPLQVTGIGTDDLVVCLELPDGSTAQNKFFFGANAAAQTSPTYISSTHCSLAEPTDLAALGFSNSHMIFDVCGNLAAALPVVYCTAR